MPYRSTDKTRSKKDARRTDMMQAAVRVFAEKGYYAATVRDIVAAANVAVGTFYFYFPDKETLFVHLYEETADFLLQSLQQAANSRRTLPEQVLATTQTYVNLATYEPAIVQLLLVGGVGAMPALNARRVNFREGVIRLWQRPLEAALEKECVPPQNTRRTAEGIAGAMDEIILNLLALPNPDLEASAAANDMAAFALRAAGYTPPDS
ncbi:MAG: TetR/AcrR family transcriptional regulator [Anaerolineales bacterium]|nr:TetR/AcrR family transcriptional regulator [Anaerolineales bacterium]MCB8950406.1 TetR/AcrR family transcriptional regulator [Ardenticatenales bacterium]